MTEKEIKELIAQMTLEEKASMVSGADFWHTDDLKVRVDIRNTGSVKGKEIVQLYVSASENISSLK